jgi:uncharacterized membrane protein YhiD involved in acid resistance
MRLKDIFTFDRIQNLLSNLISLAVGVSIDTGQLELRLLGVVLTWLAVTVLMRILKAMASHELRVAAAEEYERRERKKRAGANFRWDPKRYDKREDDDQDDDQC